MKLTYLGTAAAEGFPAVFCNCAYCNEARTLGGKNIRTRSQALINEDLLIDLPADTYFHFLQNGIRGDQIAYLLVTHAHSDHFYPAELEMRRSPFAHKMPVPKLRVIASGKTLETLSFLPKNVETTPIHAFETIALGSYRVTALPARHMPESEPFIYLIEGEKTLLYAHDTGYLYESVFRYLEEHHIVLDMISLDCTNMDIPISDEGSHMGFDQIVRVLARLASIGAVTAKTVRYVNHFSHNANPVHHLLSDRAAECECFASYDGCQVDF